MAQCLENVPSCGQKQGLARGGPGWTEGALAPVLLSELWSEPPLLPGCPVGPQTHWDSSLNLAPLALSPGATHRLQGLSPAPDRAAPGSPL